MYRVTLDTFEGPLDLLLEIIEARKLSLTELSLSRIAHQFMEYLAKIKNERPREIVEFLVVASRLTLLKSRELVPGTEGSDEGEGSLKTLAKELQLYQVFRHASRELAILNKNAARLYERESFTGFNAFFHFPRGLRADDLSVAISELLSTATMPKAIPQATIKPALSLEECLTYLFKEIKKKRSVDFSAHVKTHGEEEKVVHFLSALELIRRGKAEAYQSANFRPITLRAI
jgi:segregation and condensation protein A